MEAWYRLDMPVNAARDEVLRALDRFYPRDEAQWSPDEYLEEPDHTRLPGDAPVQAPDLALRAGTGGASRRVTRALGTMTGLRMRFYSQGPATTAVWLSIQIGPQVFDGRVRRRVAAAMDAVHRDISRVNPSAVHVIPRPPRVRL